MSGTYRDLKVWQKAMELVYAVYETTRGFPKHELYGLVSQMRRSVSAQQYRRGQGPRHRQGLGFVSMPLPRFAS